MITHSGSVEDQGLGNYMNYVLPFFRDLATKLNPTFGTTHIGVVSYSKCRYCVIIYIHCSCPYFS